MKLDYHAEPNHPAKYGGPGVHRLKVSFYRHNGMSLIFKHPDFGKLVVRLLTKGFQNLN